jgi:hypothetical protein
MPVVDVTPGAGQDKDRAGHWLTVAMIALGTLAGAAAAVSWQAQYSMVLGVKHWTWVAMLEAGIPDAGAIVFASLGIALALYGKRAVRTRALNVVCVGISLMQNALAASPGWRDLAIWVMPSAVYAVASDTLIGVVRAWAIARVRNIGEKLADGGPTPLAIAGGAALWLLRLTLAPKSTLGGFRAWVVTDCPVAPGLRPGHVAELEAVRRESGQLAALVTAERDETLARAAEEASQAREEAARAEAAQAAIRGELERVRSDAARRAEQVLADAAREREELHGRMQEQAEQARAEISQVRDDAARLAAEFAGASGARITALDDARGDLRDISGRLAAALKTAAQLQESAQRAGKPRGSRAGKRTKRDRMIELAAQRQDLATIPPQDVSKLASTVASEIGYSQGTARRELMRHVRELRSAGAHLIPDSEGGQVQ